MQQNEVFPTLSFDPVTTVFIFGTAGWTFPITDFLFLSLEGRLNVLGLAFQYGSYDIAQFKFLDDYAFDILNLSYPTAGYRPIYASGSGVNNLSTISAGIFEYTTLPSNLVFIMPFSY